MSHAGRSGARYLWAGLGLCLLLAGLVSYYASSAPDGLERVAADLGFASAAHKPTSSSPLAGYETSGLGSGQLSVGLAGAVGVLVTAALAFGLFTLLARRRPKGPTPTASVVESARLPEDGASSAQGQ